MSHSTNFSTLMIILLLYITVSRNTYLHIRKIRNLFSYNACYTIIHALVSCRLDYCNSLLYNVPTHKTDRLQRAHIDKITA